ncbi:MAG: hypothetical protein M5U14_14055 [Acidimicrobiia bacterium]|nr:hypothetical protein [Acidimicrobiia bacterium]
MGRLPRFEDNRYVGDKRRQVVYDTDLDLPEGLVDELAAVEQLTCFGPDTLAEARNRGYRPHRSIRAAGAATGS